MRWSGRFGRKNIAALSWRHLLLLVLGWRVWLFFVQLIAFRSLGLKTPIFHFVFYIWELWDGYWHTQIARFGYYAPGLTLRFPLYPLLIRLLAPILGGSQLAAALTISFIALFVALVLLRQLIRFEFRSYGPALKTITLLLLFPTAFFFVAAYQESLFLLLTIASFLSFRRDKFLYAGLFGGLAALTRPQGMLLFPSFLVARLVKRRKWEKRDAWLFFIPLALVPWCLYLYVKFGDAFLFLHDLSVWEEGSWQRARILSSPIMVLFSYMKEFFLVGGQILASGFELTAQSIIQVKEVSDFLFFILFLALGFWVARDLNLSYSIYYFLSLIMMLAVGTLKGAPRFVLVLFPGFMVLSKLLKNPKLFAIFLWVSSVGLVGLLLYFSLGYWVA
jgi:hypothetical protein